eukprot:3138508-Pleurochrysis_carterae.AAC.1
MQRALGPSRDDASVASLRIAARLQPPPPCHAFCARPHSARFANVWSGQKDVLAFTREKTPRDNSGRCVRRVDHYLDTSVVHQRRNTRAPQ